MMTSSSGVVSDAEKTRARLLSYTCQGSLIGLTSMTGALVAHEAVKSITRKFTPICQWMMFDAAEVLLIGNGSEIIARQDVSSAEFFLRNDRSDSQRVCLGEKLFSELTSQRVLLVGAGAIGCEV